MSAEFFKVFSMQPILLVLGKYLALPDIIRITATCKYGYLEWIKKIQDPFDIPKKIKPYYNFVYAVITLDDLRDFCFDSRRRNEATRGGRDVTCINCGNERETNNTSWYTAFMDYKLFPFGLCRACFFHPRRLNYSGLMHIDDAVKSLISAGCVFDVSPFDVLRPYAVNLLDGDYGRWNLIKIRTVMEIIKSSQKEEEESQKRIKLF
jgi:hypothetical protein